MTELSVTWVVCVDAMGVYEPRNLGLEVQPHLLATYRHFQPHYMAHINQLTELRHNRASYLTYAPPTSKLLSVDLDLYIPIIMIWLENA